MTSVLEVAKYVQARVGSDSNTLKVQKLCYYAQAWHLAWTGTPLFAERIEAWRLGPVCPILYDAQYHQQEKLVGEGKLSEKQRLVVDQVLEAYGNKSPGELSELTHREDPWRDARGDVSPEARTNTEISQAAMQSYFSDQKLARSEEEWSSDQSFEDLARSLARQYSSLLHRLA